MVSLFLIQYFYSPYFVFSTQSSQFLSYCWANFNYYSSYQKNPHRIQEQNSLITQIDNSKEVEIFNNDQIDKTFKLVQKKQFLLPQQQVKKQKKCDIHEITVQCQQIFEQVQIKVKSSKTRKSATKLVFQTEWKNQNRNIVPNIMNQLISYLEKSHKSEKMIERLFEKNSHLQEWTVKKFYFYMKLMKNKLGHYINENQLENIIKVQDLKCQIYSREEQAFYLKICRITLDYFLRNQVTLISLTSKRMSHQKRKCHLVARRALLHHFENILIKKQ